MPRSTLPIAQGIEDRLEFEGDGLLVARADLDESLVDLGRCRDDRAAHTWRILRAAAGSLRSIALRGGAFEKATKSKSPASPSSKGSAAARPGKPLAFGSEQARASLERAQVAIRGCGALRHNVPLRARAAAIVDPAHTRRRPRRRSAVALLATEQHPREGLESQIRRVGMSQREEVLGVEIARVAERAESTSRRREAALEVRLVGDSTRPASSSRIASRSWIMPRRRRDVLVDETGQPTDQRRNRPTRSHERRSHADRRPPPRRAARCRSR